MDRELKIAMVAGELSGDMLGAGLIRALKQRFPNLRVEGVCGPQMIAEGASSLFPLERLSVMGIFEVIQELRDLLRLRSQLIQHLIDNRPDVYIGIDAPDFNLPIERKLKEFGIPTVHYVSPSVWAWRQGRIKSIAQSIHLMLTLFPFEAKFYDQQQVKACFVGHPLADDIALEPPDPMPLRARLGLPIQGKLVVILPGSRVGEIKRLAPPFLAAAELVLQRYNDVHFVVALANAKSTEVLAPILARHGNLPVTTIVGDTRSLMAAADYLLAASGTVTLEGLLLKKPMVVAYRIAPLTYWLVKSLRLMKIKQFSLPNLLSDQPLVEEYIQYQANPQAIAQGLIKLIDQPDHCAKMIAQFYSVHRRLRGDANAKATAAIIELLQSFPQVTG